MEEDADARALRDALSFSGISRDPLASYADFPELRAKLEGGEVKIYNEPTQRFVKASGKLGQRILTSVGYYSRLFRAAGAPRIVVPRAPRRRAIPSNWIELSRAPISTSGEYGLVHINLVTGVLTKLESNLLIRPSGMRRRSARARSVVQLRRMAFFNIDDLTGTIGYPDIDENVTQEGLYLVPSRTFFQIDEEQRYAGDGGCVARAVLKYYQKELNEGTKQRRSLAVRGIQIAEEVLAKYVGSSGMTVEDIGREFDGKINLFLRNPLHVNSAPRRLSRCPNHRMKVVLCNFQLNHVDWFDCGDQKIELVDEETLLDLVMNYKNSDQLTKIQRRCGRIVELNDLHSYIYRLESEGRTREQQEMIWEWEKQWKKYWTPVEAPIVRYHEAACHAPCRWRARNLKEYGRLWGTDMKKCYSRDRNCPFYMGYPGRYTHRCQSPDLDFVLSHHGSWVVEMDEHEFLPGVTFKSGVYVTPMIQFFHTQGLRFVVKKGAWSNIHFDRADFPEAMMDQKLYTIALGRAKRVSNVKQEVFLCKSNLIQYYSNVKKHDEFDDEYLVETEISGATTGVAQSSYNYAYAVLNVLQAYQKVHREGYKVVGINIDELITLRPLPPMEGWKESVIKEESDLEDLDRAIGWSKSYVSHPYQDWEDFDDCTDGWYEGWTEIHYSGPGGSGKTYHAVQQNRWFGCGYSTHNIEMTKHQCKEYDLYWGLNSSQSHSFINLPPVLILDEHGHIMDRHLKAIRKACRRCGTKLLIAGDECQLTIGVNMVDRIEDLEELPTITMGTDVIWRCRGCPKLTELNHAARRLVEEAMSIRREKGEALVRTDLDEVNLKMNRLFRRYCWNNIPMGEQIEGIRNHFQSESEGRTIHSLQGITLKPDQCLIVHIGLPPADSVFNQFADYCVIIYTALSRAQKIEQLCIYRSPEVPSVSPMETESMLSLLAQCYD